MSPYSHQLTSHELFDASRMLTEEDLSPEIYQEYIRGCGMVGPHEPSDTTLTIDVHDVLKAHFLIIDFFVSEGGKGIGGIGVMDQNLLHSAVSRQNVSWGKQRKWQSIHEICATLLYGLIMNHPFHDANKRTAFLSSLFLLYKGGKTLTIPHRQFEDFIVNIADNRLAEFPQVKSLKKRHKSDDIDAQILFIAKFIKTATRDIDRRHYSVTFRELDKLLRRYNCFLDFNSASGGKVDVIKVVPARFGTLKKIFGREKTENKRVAKIGFSKVTDQAGREDIKIARRHTGLTIEQGVDSSVFYQGLDPAKELLAHYQQPLRRLADR